MERLGRYCVLNVVLHPHPVGSYRALFENAATRSQKVNYYGERFAKISPLTPTRDGVFTGRLATWTEINTDGNLIDKNTLDEMLFSDSGIDLSSGIGFNARVFSFAFRIAGHRLFVEKINDENEKISNGAVLKIFSAILLDAAEGHQDLSVSVVSSASAINFVLQTPNLRKLEIVVDLPNPDVLTAEKNEIIESLQIMKAKKMRVELTRQAGSDRLELTPGVRAFAELSSENGFATATGRDDDGKAIERSTKDFPEEIETVLLEDESRALGTRRIALGE